MLEFLHLNPSVWIPKPSFLTLRNATDLLMELSISALLCIKQAVRCRL